MTTQNSNQTAFSGFLGASPEQQRLVSAVLRWRLTILLHIDSEFCLHTWHSGSNSSPHRAFSRKKRRAKKRVQPFQPTSSCLEFHFAEDAPSSIVFLLSVLVYPAGIHYSVGLCRVFSSFLCWEQNVTQDASALRIPKYIVQPFFL